MVTVTLSSAKAQLTRLLAEVDELGEEVTITRSGRPVAVILPVAEYEGLLETLEILADSDLAQAIQAGLAELSAGDLLDGDEVWGDLDDSLHR